MIYSIDEIIKNARKNSQYYKDAYSKLSENIKIEDLPIVDQKEFWSANKFKENKLLTSEFLDGVLFKSGGTTGRPKFSAFTKDEWDAFTSEFGWGISQGHLKSGDHVGNLFYSGDLYASFAFIMKSLEHEYNSIVQFPMTGTMIFPEIIKAIDEYQINVLAGVPTTFLNLAEYILENNIKSEITLILFGGESLYQDQIKVLQKAFPKAKIDSIGIASVDGGHLGYFDHECMNGEHKVFQKSTLVEIIDEETGKTIKEKGKTGRLVYTNLTRKLMPIIRYPAGDMAEWKECEFIDGKFQGIKYQLHGRSDEGARVGPVTIGTDDIHDIFTKEILGTALTSFQLVINHKGGLDQLTIVLVPEEKIVKTEQELIKIIYSERPMLEQAITSGIISSIIIKIEDMEALIRNQRTGKQRLVVDLRENGKIT